MNLFDKQYLTDYTYTEEINDKGHIVTRAKYSGAFFAFVDEKKAKAAAKLMTVLLVLAWGLYLTPMCFLSLSTTVMWVMLPNIFLLIPLAFAIRKLVTALRVKAPFEHKPNDKVTNYAFVTWPGMILGAYSSVSSLVLSFTQPEKLIQPGDWLYVICNLLVAGFFALLDIKAKDMDTHAVSHG